MKNSTLLLIALASALLSCTESSTTLLIEEPAGSAHYYIDNQSNVDLKIIFTKSPELASEVDSSGVPANSSKLIFTDGIIGVNPKPSDSFSQINFYKTTEDTAVFTIDSLDNDKWSIIGRDIGDSGYGLTKYQFTITENELN